MQNKSCICCVVDENPVFRHEFLIWAKCVNKYLPKEKFIFKAYFINTIPLDLEKFAKEHSVEIVIKPSFSLESPHCNKILPYLDEANAEFEHTIVVDSDLYIVDDISCYLNGRDIRLAPNNNNNPPIEVFYNIFSTLEIDTEVRAGVSLNKDKKGIRESYINNNSGGITILPKKYFPLFGKAWAHWAKYLIDNRHLLGKWKVHVDQVSMAIFLEKNNIDINFLPPQVNCVIGLLSQVQHVKAFHLAKTHVSYFNALFDEDGCLISNKFSAYLASPIKKLNAAIREVNQVIVNLPSLASYFVSKDNDKVEWSGTHQIFKIDEEPKEEKKIKLSKKEKADLAAIKTSLKNQKIFIEESRQFDAEFYLGKYPDVCNYKNGPLTHYLKYGAKEGRDPTKFFSTFAYRGKYPSVGKSGLNPLYHYLAYGMEKGFNPDPRRFDIHKTYDQFKLNFEADLFESEQISLEVKPKVRPICFYLPQFHEIEENNKWWGKGYTEWTHVRSGIPLFDSHHQPRMPTSDIGYYNLLNEGVMERQAEMAKKAGIEGFSFYHYAFSDKRLLEKPMELLYNNKSIDLPYCIFWANHPWTKTWYGQEREILKAIDYNSDFYLQFIKDIEKYLKDDRYIRVNGKPLIMLLHHKGGDGPPSYEEAVIMTDIWREYALKSGIGEIHISFAQLDFTANLTASIRGLGFDSAFEFCPTAEISGGLTNIVSRMPFPNNFKGKIFDYEAMIERRKQFHETVEHKLFPCLTTSWDNTARYGNKATFFVDATPPNFKKWLEHNVKFLSERYNEEERLLFINGWNEWSEGSYLEPDEKYGYAYLNSITRLFNKIYK